MIRGIIAPRPPATLAKEGVKRVADPSDAEVPIMTTLHYVVQTQRMGTITESTGRSASFLQATSMALVALGFIAPATEFGPAFFAFALLLLTALILIGLVTFLRCVQLGVEDSKLALETEGIKRFYLDAAPSLRSRLQSPDVADAGEAAVRIKLPGQTLLTNASLIAFVTAALIGVVTALSAHLAGASLPAASVAAVASTAIAILALLAVQRALWKQAAARK